MYMCEVAKPLEILAHNTGFVSDVNDDGWKLPCPTAAKIIRHVHFSPGGGIARQIQAEPVLCGLPPLPVPTLASLVIPEAFRTVVGHRTRALSSTLSSKMLAVAGEGGAAGGSDAAVWVAEALDDVEGNDDDDDDK